MSDVPQPLSYLREQTGDLHRRLESGPLPKMLMSEKVAPEHYAAFLRANYRAFAALEPMISNLLADYGVMPGAKRSRLISEDLAALGAELPEPETSAEPSVLNTEPAAWGAAYVLEGSSLGGKFILKHLRQIPALKESDAFAYLSGEGVPPDHWRTFKQAADSRLNGEQDLLEAAGAAARETFLFMETAFDTEARAAGLSG